MAESGSSSSGSSGASDGASSTSQQAGGEGQATAQATATASEETTKSEAGQEGEQQSTEQKDDTTAKEKTTEKPAKEQPKPGEEPTPEPPKKHKYADRLAKAFPDRKYESDDDYDNALNEHLDGLEQYRERGEKANKKLIALFEAEPSVGEIVRDMMNGATFRSALAKHLSADDLTPVEGDDDFEEWSKNKTAREEAANKRRQFEQDYAANMEASLQSIREFAEEKGYDEAKTAELLDKFDGRMAEINSGKITKETLAWIHKAENYDNDHAMAIEKGQIESKNKEIVSTKENKPKGDGLPNLKSSSENPTPVKKEGGWIDRLVDDRQKREVI